MDTKLMFSSAKQDWETPQDFYDKLNEEFHFCVDLAANYKNAKHSNFFTEEDNALIQNWKSLNTKGEFLYCNPPYKTSKDWIKKAYEEHLKGTRIVMLLPARTDTRAFHEYIYNKPGIMIRFLKGRLKFGGAKNTAPFPSMIVIFTGRQV